MLRARRGILALGALVALAIGGGAARAATIDYNSTSLAGSLSGNTLTVVNSGGNTQVTLDGIPQFSPVPTTTSYSLTANLVSASAAMTSSGTTASSASFLLTFGTTTVESTALSSSWVKLGSLKTSMFTFSSYKLNNVVQNTSLQLNLSTPSYSGSFSTSASSPTSPLSSDAIATVAAPLPSAAYGGLVLLGVAALGRQYRRSVG